MTRVVLLAVLALAAVVFGVTRSDAHPSSQPVSPLKSPMQESDAEPNRGPQLVGSALHPEPGSLARQGLPRTDKLINQLTTFGVARIKVWKRAAMQLRRSGYDTARMLPPEELLETDWVDLESAVESVGRELDAAQRDRTRAVGVLAKKTRSTAPHKLVPVQSIADLRLGSDARAAAGADASCYVSYASTTRGKYMFVARPGEYPELDHLRDMERMLETDFARRIAQIVMK
jgi:hypothetical protein